MIQNDLFLKALNNETVERPPVWMMRQAGRYLPEFMAIKEKYDFFTRCKTPELASEITVQPIRIIKPDAAILFSDILVIPQAMGIDVELEDGIGPVLPNPIRKASDVDNVFIPDINETLGYVMDAIDMTREKLNNEVPLIGFAGSPWTIFCYAVEGKGSKSFDKAKGFCFSNPVAAHLLLQKITDTTILYLIITLVSFVYFNIRQLEHTIWPTLVISKIIQLPFIERFEYIYIFAWLLIILPPCCVFLWGGTRILRTTINLKPKTSLWITSAIIFMIIINLKNQISIEKINTFISITGIIFLYGYIPVLSLWVSAMTFFKKKYKKFV